MVCGGYSMEIGQGLNFFLWFMCCLGLVMLVVYVSGRIISKVVLVEGSQVVVCVMEGDIGIFIFCVFWFFEVSVYYLLCYVNIGLA